MCLPASQPESVTQSQSLRLSHSESDGQSQPASQPVRVTHCGCVHVCACALINRRLRQIPAVARARAAMPVCSLPQRAHAEGRPPPVPARAAPSRSRGRPRARALAAEWSVAPPPRPSLLPTSSWGPEPRPPTRRRRRSADARIRPGRLRCPWGAMWCYSDTFHMCADVFSTDLLCGGRDMHCRTVGLRLERTVRLIVRWACPS